MTRARHATTLEGAHVMDRRLVLAATLALLAACGASSSPAACVDGQAGCACRVDDTCDDGLACDVAAHTCEATHAVSLPAIDPAARACEVLLADDGARVVRARFDASVRGETVRQAPRTAVTFHAMGDARIGRDAVRIELTGPGGMAVVRGRCFDRDGRPLPGGGLGAE